MPDMTIEIGGRAFTVACQDGEEGYLKAAAELLDREAQALGQAGGRLTQDRMLLMAGLMLADKTISADEELRALDRRLSQQTQLIDEMQSRAAPEPVEIVREVEKEVVRETVPQSAIDRLEALAAQAEKMAAEAGELA
ncbi:cell division protein ZapA [Jannaschia ovalis]|uniref:Cell division protein ZapA n=1 Tax=Jannaschia ovalis TaxID=3038773 RepID=A0ABY8LE91_9RHOB|nr:cell division protein ZapA [Jannaschia sp. GRR-S6-38]WGH78380.1 cell division protein ZapA [Jannaschia sp. GRR-S6-38]